MRLRLLDRIRRLRRRQQPDKVRARDRGDAAPGPAPSGVAGAHRRVGRERPAPARPGPGQPANGARLAGPAPQPPNVPRQGGQAPQQPGGARPGGQAWQVPPAAVSPRPAAGGGSPAGRGSPGGHGSPASHALPRRWTIARAATRAATRADTAPRPAARAQPGASTRAAGAVEAKPPWYEIAQSNRTAAGRRHCGHIEKLIHREWAQDVTPPPEVVRAIDRLAELPQLIKARLAAGLDAIYVGMGGVPNLDDMGRLAGVPLPSGRATWDACAGAYGERKIIVGSRPSPSPDVMCHEIGHALDDIDGSGEQWQSDSEEFHSLYDQCLPHMVSAFHRQPGLLGRREFFADAFAAIASRQRPALVEMLGGDTRSALNVMLYFNIRYGI
jgi:hypothetical protein